MENKRTWYCRERRPHRILWFDMLSFPFPLQTRKHALANDTREIEINVRIASRYWEFPVSRVWYSSWKHECDSNVRKRIGKYFVGLLANFYSTLFELAGCTLSVCLLFPVLLHSHLRIEIGLVLRAFGRCYPFYLEINQCDSNWFLRRWRSGYWWRKCWRCTRIKNGDLSSITRFVIP